LEQFFLKVIFVTGILDNGMFFTSLVKKKVVKIVGFFLLLNSSNYSAAEHVHHFSDINVQFLQQSKLLSCNQKKGQNIIRLEKKLKKRKNSLIEESTDNSLTITYFNTT